MSALLSKTLLSTIFFIGLSSMLLRTSLAQEETHCRGHEVKLTVKQKGQITECLEEAGIKSFWKIPAEKLPCLGVCILEKKEMLTADGRIDHAKALAYIDAVMTGPVKKPLIDGIDKCIKDHGDKIKMDKDPKCLTFMDVGQCVHDVFFEVICESSARPRILYATRMKSSAGRRRVGPPSAATGSGGPGIHKRAWAYIVKIFRLNKSKTGATTEAPPDIDSLIEQLEQEDETEVDDVDYNQGVTPSL